MKPKTKRKHADKTGPRQAEALIVVPERTERRITRIMKSCMLDHSDVAYALIARELDHHVREWRIGRRG